MKVIDFRLRPPFGTFLNSFLFVKEDLNASAKKFGFAPSAAAIDHSMEELLQEMDEAGVVLGVTPIRVTTKGDNGDIAKLTELYPERFKGMAWIDPLREDALAKIDEYVTNGAASGITIEPGMDFTPERFFVEDERAYPVYEKCERENIPILLTYGGIISDQKYYEPTHIHRVAKDFPKLKMVLGHGCFPHITEICHTALQCANLYIAPDIYMYSLYPGAEIYAKAANYILQDNFIFGSVYPGLPLKVAVDDYLAQLRPEVAEKVMYQNAAKVLDL